MPAERRDVERRQRDGAPKPLAAPAGRLRDGWSGSEPLRLPTPGVGPVRHRTPRRLDGIDQQLLMPTNNLGPRVPLYGLVVANAVSLLGNTIAAVAIPWFILVTTGSAARMGVAAFFTTVPLALGALFGGVVADRVGARTASVVGDLLSGIALAGIPLLHGAGVLEFWHVLALGFLGALFDAPAQAARESLLPEFAERAGVPLDRANSLWTSTEHGGYVLGAPAAGFLIAAFGAPAALWLDAATFVATAATVFALVPAVSRVSGRTSYVSELLDGVRFVASRPLLRMFFVTATIGNFLIAPLASVVLPFYAREVFGSAASLGAMTAAYGLGGLAGAALAAFVATRVRRRTTWAATWIAYALLCFGLVPVPGLVPVLLLLAAIGLAAGALSPIEQSVRQEETPPELRARVFSLFMASLAIVVPLAVLPAGLLVETAGLRAALVMFAVGNAVLALAVVASPSARRV